MVMKFYVHLQEKIQKVKEATLRILTPRLDPLYCAAGFAIGFLSVLVWFTRGTTPTLYDHALSSTMLVESADSWGSGVVVERTSAEGRRVFLWTAAHVVDTDPFAVHAKILFKQGDRRLGEGVFPAIPLAVSKPDDLALYWVQVPDDMVEDIVFADVAPQPVGTHIYHVGNFLGINFPGSVTLGVVSGTGRTPPRLDGWFWPLTDQADLTVLPGGSGGGVFNASGEVIGIMVAGVGGTSSFVPNRVLQSWANKNAVGWAFSGSVCPADATLVMLADILRQEWSLQAVLLQLPP